MNPVRSEPHQRRSASQRREDILEAALAEFAFHGYHATRTAAIAQRAGISQPYIYALFPDKKVLFLACHERAMERLRRALFQAAPASDGTGGTSRALASVEEAFRDLVGSDPVQLMFHLQSHAAASDPEIRDVVRGRFMAMADEGVRATGAPRTVVLERLARGLFFSVALALELPGEYRLPAATGAQAAADHTD